MSNEHLPKAIFLDAGHTLLKAHPSTGEIYARVTKRFGVNVSPARFVDIFYRLFHNPEVEKYRRALPAGERGEYTFWHRLTADAYNMMDELDGIDFDKWFSEIYREFARGKSWRISGGYARLRTFAHQNGIKLGIISNWDHRLRGILKDLKIYRDFKVIAISAEVGARKPDKKIFRWALNKMKVIPEDAVHIGDHIDDDYYGATSVGMRAILYRRNEAGEKDTERAKTCIIASSLAQIPRILKSVGRQSAVSADEFR